MIKNKTKKTTIAGSFKEANSILDKAFGLLRQSNPRTMFFKTSFGIHTFFMKDPIDVIVLDKNFQVKKVKKNLRPNSLFFWNPKYSLVLELPPGTIKKSRTELLDKLDLT